MGKSYKTSRATVDALIGRGLVDFVFRIDNRLKNPALEEVWEKRPSGRKLVKTHSKSNETTLSWVHLKNVVGPEALLGKREPIDGKTRAEKTENVKKRLRWFGTNLRFYKV